MLIDDADWCLHSIVMHARLTVARRRLAIRSRLVDAYRVRICNLLRVDRRDVFVRTGHLLLHRDLLVVIIVTTSSTFVPHSLRFIGLGI
jgi:hypothetical protein